MELAQRIKTARLEAGLSQRQLCGDTITRNMLSLIESGKARPSMDTLQHFSQVLGKPLSWFLDEDAVLSPNQEIMAQCEKAFSAGDFSRILPLLENYRAPDSSFDATRYLLEVLTCEALAQDALQTGKKAYALSLLDRADAAAALTPYAPDAGKRTLLRWQADPKSAQSAHLPITQRLLLHADAAIQQQDYPRAAALLDAADQQPPLWHLLRGTVALQLGDAAKAAIHLHQAEQDYPAKAIPLLEQAYLALEDYKRAYEYAKRAP